jgi:hypothetical protein
MPVMNVVEVSLARTGLKDLGSEAEERTISPLYRLVSTADVAALECSFGPGSLLLARRPKDILVGIPTKIKRHSMRKNAVPVCNLIVFFTGLISKCGYLNIAL